MESVENQTQVFQRFPPPLENPANAAGFSHFHRLAGAARKSGKPRAGFPLSRPVPAMTTTVDL